ncbi:unnamed protein product [Vicia faba]|uniref:Uncharacterized protein n=1 Tax=Vicia faba TaxID=3906 RepID=A0AAV1ARG2_VICFA|nr:unnamed protein product [Vicia faba]
MREEIQHLFYKLCYEEGFGLDKVSPIEVKIKRIDTKTIASAISQEERRKIFYNMDKVDKLKKLFDLANSQRIQAVVPPPSTIVITLETTTYALTLAPIFAVGTSTSRNEVDQLVDDVVTMTMEELSPLRNLTTRFQDKKQRSLGKRFLRNRHILLGKILQGR